LYLNIIGEQEMNNLENAEFAVQKDGRLTQGSLDWMNERFGTKFPVVPEPFDRTRELRDEKTGITVTGYSNGDVLKAVACGMADYGIAGEDKLDELLYPQNGQYMPPEGGFNRYANLSALGIVQPALCRLVVARRTGEEVRPIRRIATSYPNLTRQMLERRPVGTPPVEAVDVFGGGVEPIARKYDYDTVVDIVQTGGTLTANGFVETEELKTYSSVLVCRYRNPLSPALFDALKGTSVLDALADRLSQRLRRPTGSEASRLVASPGAALRKWNEETAEFQVAFVQGEVADIELEAADVLFSLSAMLAGAGVSFDRVMTELAGRYQGQQLQAAYLGQERRKLPRPFKY
jgi:ATP phosphoribosyltransferase